MLKNIEWIDFSYFIYREWMDGKDSRNIHDYLFKIGAEYGLGFVEIMEALRFWARLAEEELAEPRTWTIVIGRGPWNSKTRRGRKR